VRIRITKERRGDGPPSITIESGPKIVPRECRESRNGRVTRDLRMVDWPDPIEHGHGPVMPAPIHREASTNEGNQAGRESVGLARSG
jgi:hypothetical protein